MQFLPNFIVFACGAPLPFGNFLTKRPQITFGAVAKGHPFDHFACGICDLHAIYRWEILIQKKNGGEFKILFTIRGFCIYKGLPTIALPGQSYLVRKYL